MFVSQAIALRGFDESISTGSPSPWQAGEGTELLMWAMSAGKKVVAAPDVLVEGQGECRTLDSKQLKVKRQSYARGTGHVLRLHHVGLLESSAYVQPALLK